MQNHTLLFLVLWPMFGGLLSYIAGRFSRNIRDYLADIVCLNADNIFMKRDTVKDDE